MSVLSRLYDQLDAPERGDREIQAFLPAALEIQETPPSPIGRVIVWLIILLFLIACIWAYFGEIDIVAVAPGKVIPSDRVKTIQPLEIGVVKSIHVAEGDQVQGGQPLITLDATHTMADERRMQVELTDARSIAARQSRYAAYLSGSSDESFNWPDDADPSQVNVQERFLTEQINEYRARLDTIDNQHRQREAEYRAVSAEITKLERTLPIVSQRAVSLEKLLADKMVSESAYLELEQARIEAEQDLAAGRSRLDEVGAALAALKDQRAAVQAEAQRTNLGDLQETQRRIAVLEQEFVKAEQRRAQQTLTSPIDGVIHDLNIFTVGGVVTPAERLMSVVPTNSQLEVEAYVLNKDIGFVEEGQISEVKIDTFNFSKYGSIEGELLVLSDDAESHEVLGLVYQAKVKLHDTKLFVDEKWVNLSPGMSVTVEVKTGTRRIIEFFLSPLLRYRDESIRER